MVLGSCTRMWHDDWELEDRMALHEVETRLGMIEDREDWCVVLRPTHPIAISLGDHWCFRYQEAFVLHEL